MTSMRMGQMQKLCIEIYKTPSDTNPRHMQELFERSSSSYSTRRPNDLKVPGVNQATYGSRSSRLEGARLWNHLPNHIKSAENLNIFKNLVSTGLVLLVDATTVNLEINDFYHPYIDFKILLLY